MESAFHDRQPIALAGLIPATVVPMSATGAVDWDGLRRYLGWVAAEGPVALAVTADTGEVGQLTHAEQLRVVEVAKEVTGVSCVAGLTADPATARAVERAADLRRAGADALLLFPRPSFATASQGAVLDYHRAVGDAGLPLIAFQLQPALGGVRYSPALLRRLLALDAVVALKEASFDRAQFQAAAAVASEAAGVTLLTGNDNFILESFALGAEGALLGFGAVLTGAQVAMIGAWRAGRVDQAAALSARLQPVADAVFAPPVNAYRARLKECLVLLGVLDRAQAHVRSPGRPLDEGERDRLRRVLSAEVAA